MIAHTVPETVRPIPAERYIGRAWPMLPKHALRDLFKDRNVRVNGVRLKAEDPVRGGDRMELFLPDRYLPAPVRTVFADDRLVAAVKPQGLPVDTDRDGIGADTLLTRLQSVYPTAALCHRLDAMTGGLVLAALDPDTLTQAEETFRAHALHKRYLACLCERPKRPEGTLRDWLVKDAGRAEVRVLHTQRGNARPIETRYRVLGTEGGLTYAELEPVTGRTHQLRAHMASIGCPILGDDAYGDRTVNRKAGGPLRLWCAELDLAKDAPLTGYAGRRFVCDPPTWWPEGTEGRENG